MFRMYLWWSSRSRILYLLACQVRVAVGDSGLLFVCHEERFASATQVLCSERVNETKDAES